MKLLILLPSGGNLCQRNTGILSPKSPINNSRTFLNDYKDKLVLNNQTVINKTKTLLFHNKSNLSFIASTLVSKPQTIASNKLNDLANIISNINSFKNSYLRNQGNYLRHFVSVINLMSPKNILKKGFAIVKYNGVVTSNPEELNPGADIEVILMDKTIKSTVKSKSNYNGSEFDL